MEKKALGKGLKALIGEPEEFARYEASSRSHIDTDLIEPNPDQPREDFDERQLADLVSSIKAEGVLQPIIVRQIGDRYQIIAGERRWRAAVKAGLMSIPATIREAADADILKIALIENLLRQDLNPMEEANAYKEQVIATAEGDASRFNSLATEYKKAPEVTRTRLYLETMEEILSAVDSKIIIDESVRGLLPLLDLGAYGSKAAQKGGAR